MDVSNCNERTVHCRKGRLCAFLVIFVAGLACGLGASQGCDRIAFSRHRRTLVSSDAPFSSRQDAAMWLKKTDDGMILFAELMDRDEAKGDIGKAIAIAYSNGNPFISFTNLVAMCSSDDSAVAEQAARGVCLYASLLSQSLRMIVFMSEKEDRPDVRKELMRARAMLEKAASSRKSVAE